MQLWPSGQNYNICYVYASPGIIKKGEIEQMMCCHLITEDRQECDHTADTSKWRQNGCIDGCL